MKKLKGVLLLTALLALGCNKPKMYAGVVPSTFESQNITATTNLNAAALFTLGDAGILPPTAAGGNAVALQCSGINCGFNSLPRAYFGDGNDGTCTFDGTATPSCSTKNSSTSYTINRDCYCANASVGNSVTVHANGWRLFANATLTFGGSGSGLIDNSGAAGANGTGSGTAAGGASGVSNYIGGTSQAGAGGNAAAGGGSVAVTGYGGAGGAGGTSGQAGGTVALTATGFRPADAPEAISTLIPGASLPAAGNMSLRGAQGGAGGGGGVNTGNNGGAGGGGGGVVVVAAYYLSGPGTIAANGGSGGTATGSGSPGGGGGGGLVILVSNNATTWVTSGGGTVSVAGGGAGTGGLGGATAGSSGTPIELGG